MTPLEIDHLVDQADSAFSDHDRAWLTALAVGDYDPDAADQTFRAAIACRRAWLRAEIVRCLEDMRREAAIISDRPSA